jgi:mono/diheme cytochrome c family protein
VAPKKLQNSRWALFAVAFAVATPALASSAGQKLFATNCAVCHQVDGRGIAAYYPPLAESIGAYVALPRGRAYLVHVVSFGMMGPVSVHGQTYDGFMQPWPQLSDAEVAGVLNYVLASFNRDLLPKDFAPVSEAEVKRLRSPPMNVEQVHADRETLMKTLSAKAK